MLNKKKLTRIFLLSAAGVLTVLAVAAIFRQDAPEPSQPAAPVVIEASAAPEPDIVDVTPLTPSPAPAEALPEGACTLLADRTPVLTMRSEQELTELLNAYLRASAVAPEGERFLAASFACELILAPAEEGASLTEADDALALLTNTPSAVPVRVNTEKLSRTEAPVEKNETQDKALYSGSRIITQLGTAGLTLTSTQKSYVAGKAEDEGAPVELTARESRALLVTVGAWKGHDKPAKDEGVKGKDAGALKLGYPMRGNIVSFFGLRDGNMHSGLDIRANAGTAITAPGEGVIAYCGERGAYGYVVDIDHGAGFVSRLTHLDPASVQVELHQRVFAGDQLGALAAAGTEEKPHLHYELIIDSVPYNPLFYIG